MSRHAMTGRNIFGCERPGPDQCSVADIVAGQWCDSDSFECGESWLDPDWALFACGDGTISSIDGHSARWRS